MDAAPARSTDVTSTLTVPLARRPTRHGLDFEALYRAARDDVYAYVATFLGDHAAAEDVTASAFERAYRRQGTYRAARGSERAWLFGIARNAALDELRRRRRSAALAAEPADVEAAPAEDAAEAALRRAGGGAGGRGGGARRGRSRGGAAARRPARGGGGPAGARARADCAEVPRRPRQRRARRRPRRLPLQRRHSPPPRRPEAAKGHR